MMRCEIQTKQINIFNVGTRQQYAPIILQITEDVNHWIIYYTIIAI